MDITKDELADLIDILDEAEDSFIVAKQYIMAKTCHELRDKFNNALDLPFPTLNVID